MPDATRTFADIVMGGGAPPPAKLIEGVWLGGRVVATGTYHSREYDRENPGKGALRYFDNGDPIMGVWIDVATDLRETIEDDGVRRLWCDKPRQLKAIRDALIAVREKDVTTGGTFYLCQTGSERGQGSIEANTYAAQYTPPGNVGAVVNAAPVAPQGIPQAPPAAPAVSHVPPAVAAIATPVAPQGIPQVPPAAPKPMVGARAAAAMAAAGIDVSAYTIVPD